MATATLSQDNQKRHIIAQQIFDCGACYSASRQVGTSQSTVPKVLNRDAKLDSKLHV